MAEEPNNKLLERMERIGKYEILDHIATGGMGAVYKARDVELDRVVALKVVRETLAKDEKTLERFRREAKASAQLRHENIVAIYDFGEHNGTYFLALEYVRGTDLQDYINRKCRLDPEESRQIIMQATRALIHANERKIVHRDIKPSNFLLAVSDKRVVVKLTDFGLAIRSENDEEFRITRDGTTVGTVDYMSPEQARNSKSVDIRSDIYSLGCTFYHMLAGSAPFARGTLPERLISHMQAPPPDVRKLNKNVPDSLMAIVNRMLAKKPDDRYQTPSELLAALASHEKVVSATAPGAKAGRTTARSPRTEPTVVLETRDLDEESAEPKPVKGTRAKKEPVEPAKENATKAPRVKSGAAGEKLEEEAKIESGEQSIEEPVQTLRTGKKADRWSEGEDEPVRKKLKQTSKKKQPLWVYASGGSLGALALVLVLAVSFGGRKPTPAPAPKEQERERPDPDPVFVIPEAKVVTPPPLVPAIDTSAEKMNTGPLPWPDMVAGTTKADPAALRNEFRGTFTTFHDVPETARKLQVRRLGTTGSTTYRTLAEALAKSDAGGWTVIEIADNGPLCIPVLPVVAGRSILLRGADGYRPLIVWEVPKTADKEMPATSWFSLTQGELVLENLDIVVKWTDEAPATLFDIQEGDFQARECTFSASNKASPGITIVRHRAGSDNAKATRAANTWLRRCYVRGADVTLLNATRTAAALLVEESLIVGQHQPLIDLRQQDDDRFSLHAIRSTLVTGQVLVRWQSASGKRGSPPLHGFVLDSILSRNDPDAALGDMVHLAEGADASRMTWKVANCVYAGWKRLLASADKDIVGDDLDGWRQKWSHRDGDRALVEPWPSNPLSRLDEVSANMFSLPATWPAAYAARTGSGAIGCVVGRLPAEPVAWHKRVFTPVQPPLIPTAAFDQSPVIEPVVDGLYPGEVIDLSVVRDLGEYLHSKFKTVVPAPRVVLHVKGSGIQQTSALRVQGIQNLVIYFVPSRNPKEAPLALEVNPTSFARRAPLIEMSGGNLEIIGARIQLSQVTIVPGIIDVQGGDLTLTRCTLQGPLTSSADGFKALISVRANQAVPATVLLRDNILLSGGLLLHVQDQVQIKARNNLFLSLGDGMLYEGSRSISSSLLHLLDHNTWAVRQTTFRMQAAPGFQPDGPMILHVNSNAFINPFTEDADKGVLLRGFDAAAARGYFQWQGRFNVYDARLHAYFGALDNKGLVKQGLSDWQAAWGSVAEQSPLLFKPGPTTKGIAMDTIAPLFASQLDRLALPSQLSGDPTQAPPGANLVTLGILKKKG